MLCAHPNSGSSRTETRKIPANRKLLFVCLFVKLHEVNIHGHKFQFRHSTTQRPATATPNSENFCRGALPPKNVVKMHSNINICGPKQFRQDETGWNIPRCPRTQQQQLHRKQSVLFPIKAIKVHHDVFSFSFLTSPNKLCATETLCLCAAFDQQTAAKHNATFTEILKKEKPKTATTEPSEQLNFTTAHSWCVPRGGYCSKWKETARGKQRRRTSLFFSAVAARHRYYASCAYPNSV